MKPEIYRIGQKYAFRCKECGRVEPSNDADDLFLSQKEAETALRIHKLGCKKS